jgi:hypothetical protein
MPKRNTSGSNTGKQGDGIPTGSTLLPLTPGKPRIVPRRRDSYPEPESENPNFSYRGLRADENPLLGLQPKGYGRPRLRGPITIAGHMDATRPDTPFLASSRSLKPATFFAHKTPKNPTLESGKYGNENLTGRKNFQIAKIRTNRVRDRGTLVLSALIEN